MADISSDTLTPETNLTYLSIAFCAWSIARGIARAFQDVCHVKFIVRCLSTRYRGRRPADRATAPSMPAGEEVAVRCPSSLRTAHVVPSQMVLQTTLRIYSWVLSLICTFVDFTRKLLNRQSYERVFCAWKSMSGIGETTPRIFFHGWSSR